MRILRRRKLVFVAKPRCASTSIRNLLSKHVNLADGDVACNVPDPKLGLHPHLPAPLIAKFIKDKLEEDPDGYTFFTIIRNPIDMLRSYFSFFKPDLQYRYTFSNGYDHGSLASFDQWLIKGSTKLPQAWKKYVPSFIDDSNFSGLSLESRAFDSHGFCKCDFIFKIENPASIEAFLSSRLGSKVIIPRVNQSSRTPNVDDMSIAVDALDRLAMSFPLERALYADSMPTWKQ
jgi:hypothetical protein